MWADQKTRRPKSWLYRVVVGVILSILATTVWLVLQREWRRWDGNRDLAAAVAEADAADPGWRWAPLNAARPRPPAEQNSGPVMTKIKALSAKDWGKWTVDPNEPNVVPDLASNVRYPERALTAARADLKASAEAVRLARTLKRMPSGHREIVLAENPLGTLLVETQDTRHASDVLRWDLTVALDDGNAALVGDDLLAGLNVSRSIGDEPFLISQLVRLATRAIAVRSVERALGLTARAKDLEGLGLPALQAALAADAEEPILLFGLRGERAVTDVLFEKMSDGTLDTQAVADGAKPDSWFSFGTWLYRGRIPADRAFATRWMTDAVEVARRPVHEQPAGIAALPDAPNDGRHVLSRLLLPAVDKVAEAFWRNVAEARCAVTGVACERYRLEHGRWPDTLADLCPEFLPAVPLDPYDGQPLKFAKQPDGVVVHTAGPNPLPKRGDAMAFNRPNTPRPGLPPGITTGFRLWNPPARRQPPPAEPEKPKDEDGPP